MSFILATHTLTSFTGNISHAEVLGQHIIVLNNADVAMEMLDKKSSFYSDRPVLPMGGELVGWKNTLVLLPYGDRLREYRKNFARVIGSRAAMNTYHPIEEMETRRFLQRVLAKPTELSQHVRHTAGAIILRISHGYEVKENHDPFVDLADRAVDQFSKSTATGAFLVDVIPARRSSSLPDNEAVHLISVIQSLTFPIGSLVRTSRSRQRNGGRPSRRWFTDHTNLSRIRWWAGPQRDALMINDIMRFRRRESPRNPSLATCSRAGHYLQRKTTL
jgi:hypothetical protein